MNQIPREDMEEFHTEWEKVLGPRPEERQPGDLTAAEISDQWKIDRTQIYKMAEEGKLLKRKVIDPKSPKKSVIVYRLPK